MVGAFENPMSVLSHKPNFIYISGCDGTGKSTQVQLLLAQMRANGAKVRPLWLRYPFFICTPLLVYARLQHYSWVEVNGSYKQGYWDFHNSWLMRRIFPWLLLFDTFLASLIKVTLPLKLGWTIVCERYILDILVDLAVATQELDLWDHLPGKLFLRLIPKNSRIFILDLDSETIKQRREDLQFDRYLERRLHAFRNFSAYLGIVQISNSKSQVELHRSILYDCI
jgi:thymidylate kinase